jgi:hypothetical protein
MTGQNDEEVTIMEDPAQDRGCHNCGVRFGSAKRSQSVGKQQAINERTPICVRCTHHPNMALVQSIGGGLVKRLVGEIVDNWRPLTDEDKSCVSCKVKRTIDARGMCSDSSKIVQAKCLFCKYSKNAALVMAANEKAGVQRPLEENWVSFEA